MLKEKRVELNEVDILYYGGLNHGGLDYFLDDMVKDPSSSTGFSLVLRGFGSDDRPDEVVTLEELVKRVMWTMITEGEIEDVEWKAEFVPRSHKLPPEGKDDFDLDYMWKLVLTSPL